MKTILSLALVVLTAWSASAQTSAHRPRVKKMAGYVMVYHKDADHGLHMAYSWDGYTWTALADDKPIMAGDTIAVLSADRDAEATPEHPSPLTRTSSIQRLSKRYIYDMPPYSVTLIKLQ